MTSQTSKLERDFQSDLIKDIKTLLPGCVVLKQDPNYMQGIPDLLVLWGARWALLEVKRDPKSKRQPNQPFYIEQFNNWSFAAFIHSENKQEVLDELQHAFGVPRNAFVPKPKQAPLGQLRRRETRSSVHEPRRGTQGH